MDAVEQRLTRLESSLFRWKLVAAGSLSASLAWFCIGLAPAGRDMEFKNLTVRGNLTVKDDKTGSVIVLHCSPQRGAGILMKSQNGKSEVQLDASEFEGSPPSAWVIASTSEELAGPQNKGAIYVNEEGGRLQLFRGDKGKTFEAPPVRKK